MEELKFNVYKNCLTIEDPFKPHIHPAADTVKYLEGTFTFDSTWDGFEKRVYFKNASYNIVKSVLLGDSNNCYVPWEILAHTGVIRCNIIGLKYSDDIVTQRITTNPVVFEIIVDESILEPYDQQPLTPTEYEQFRILFNGVYESTIEAKDETIDAKDDVLEAISTLDIPLEQAQEYAETSEAYAVGTRSGNPVESDDPAYDNNARYYSQRSFEYMESASTAKEDAEDAKEDANSSKLDAAAFANSSLLFAYDSEAYAVGKRGGTDVEYSDITFENNSKYYKEAAAVYSTNARDFSLKSEGFSVGEQNGQPVSSDSPYYHNNAKYYYEHMSNGVFIAIYGETPYVDIHNAYGEGKLIYLRTDEAGYYHYYPTDVTDIGTLLLRYVKGRRLYTVTVLPSDMWSSSYVESQEKLVSGTNIKTINNESLLGSGNIDIQSGGASAFIAEYGVTTYADVKDAYDEDAIILCTVDDSGNTAILQLAYFDDANDMFYFAQPNGDGWHWASIAIDNTWDDGSFQFAPTDTATTSADGLMSSSDKTKLDGIQSGAQVNYVTNITQHFIANPSDPQNVYSRSATLDYNAVGINDVELLTKDALGEFNGVCDLDASSKVPKSRLPSTSTPTADEVSKFDSSAHMNSTDMTTGADSELEDFIDGLNVSGGGGVTMIPLTVSNLSHIASASAEVYKWGKVGLLFINIKNTTSSLAVGNDATCTVSGLPTLACAGRGVGWSGDTALLGYINAITNNMIFRITGAAWAASYDGTLTIPLLFA